MAQYSQTQRKCYTEDEIKTYNGVVDVNPNGVVSVYLPNNVGVLTPYQLSSQCCKILGSQYFFDIESQKCRWAEVSEDTCGLKDPFKLVLNPKGNDGTIFYIDEGQTCELSIDFKYLFKVKCETLSEIINPKAVPVSTPIPPNMEEIYIKFAEAIGLENVSIDDIIKYLENQIQGLLKECGSYTNQISWYQTEIDNTPYSIYCSSITGKLAPTVNVASPTLTEGFKSGFASRTNLSPIAPFSFDLGDYTDTNLCLTEPEGLAAWEELLGAVNYQAFLAGDPNSYTCKDVDVMVSQNFNNSLLTPAGPVLLNTCDVPFGTKTNLIASLNELLILQQNCNTTINTLQQQLTTLTQTTTTESNTICKTPIEFFETFNVSVTLDLVTGGTVQTVTTFDLFNTIGDGQLYNYLVAHPEDSGFYVCGDNGTECVPMTLDAADINDTNTEICDNVMNNLLTSLFAESGLSGTTNGPDVFNTTLPFNGLASKWLNFHTVVSDQDIISLIANQKIKISLEINHACGDFCVLIDEIVLDKNCKQVTSNNIFVTQSPGFELDRIRDNKKSWIANTTPENRPFKISNNLGGQSIRQTNYDVNDERLVINTKEIDLDINIASAIETDVWCYISDNPCLLSGTCAPLEFSCPAGYTLLNDNITCQKIEYTAVTTGSTVYTAIEGAKRCDSIVTYGELGGVFYPDLTTLNLPLNVTGGTLHVQSVVIDSFNNIVPIEATVLNSVWGNGAGPCGVFPCDSSCPPFFNRINEIGLWTSPTAPNTEWVGWSFCVDIPTTGVYTIGIAADDACRVKVNGNMTFSFDAAGWNFLAFRMFPITLSAGLNIIEMEIANFGGGSATLAAEIYSATTSVISGITSDAELSPYIVFSTGDYVGQPWQTGEDSGFSCPSGYALNTCVNPYTCVKITKTEATIEGDCCDPCSTPVETCGNKQFQDDECFYFMDSQVYEFMDGDFIVTGETSLNGSNCCGDEIDFSALMTQSLSAVTTIEDFEYFLTSELIDAKNRQTISGYPTLRALYDRYMNSGLYCGNESSKFNYISMDQFANLVGNYWVDIVEQVVPATTIWGSVKVYSNTFFDQQKYKYKSYTSLFCENPFSGTSLLSPINGVTGMCSDVEVIMTPLNIENAPNVRIKNPKTTCNSICIGQMNSGSEFVGTVEIIKIKIGGPVRGGSVGIGDGYGSYVAIEDLASPL